MLKLLLALSVLAAGTSCANILSDQSVRLSATDSLTCGPPNYGCSYEGTDPKPLCTDCVLPQVPDMSAEPNAVWYDKVLGITPIGNQIVRCTYPDLNAKNNLSYGIGFGGSGDTNAIGKAGGAPPSYRLIIGDSQGWAYPFTYTPDAGHPTCVPTYPIGSFRVTDGSFSWLTPHLYYAFGGHRFVVNAIDLDSIRLPERKTIADFQQILPRSGPDWPGPNQPVALGTIIRPIRNNPGKYLYQATCLPKATSCAPGETGATAPPFSQPVMTDTPDGAVVWRNIGSGFNESTPWFAIGGVSTDDDVFAKSFSSDGGQGGHGAIFVAVYKRSANIYFLYNVGTGIISYSTCKDGTDYQCSGGSWVHTVLGMTNLPDRFFLHNLRLSKNGEWLLLEQDSCAFQTCSVIPGGPGMYVWQLSTTNASVKKITSHPWGHWTAGFDFLVNQDGDTGVNLNGRAFSDPDNQFPLNYFSFRRPENMASSAHPSWNYNDGSDTTPVCTATANFDWPYILPWENEVICYGTNPDPNCSSPGHGVCRSTVKRFFHTYNPTTCDQDLNFDGCWGIGTLSQDGKYYAFASNWGDTLGSRTKGGHGPGSCNGAFNFQPDHHYQSGDIFEPGHRTGNNHPNRSYNVYQVTVAGSSSSYPEGSWPQAWSRKWGNYQNGATILPLNAPNNPCNHVFQVTAGGGSPSGSNPPIWKDVYGYKDSCSSVTTGATVQDGGITWADVGEYKLGSMRLANLGGDDCRSDVFIGALN